MPYDEREQQEVIDSLSFPEEELNELIANHAAMMDLLKEHGLTDLNDHDAFFDLFYDEDLAFRIHDGIQESYPVAERGFPRSASLGLRSRLSSLTEINVLAGRHLRDERMSMKGIPPKLRSITDEYLESRGIETKVEPISILDEDFQKQVNKHKRTKTKAAEVEHAIRHHLDVELVDDPDLQASFSEALTAILEEFHDNWDKIYEELEKLRERIQSASKEPTYGLHRKKQMPFYRMFAREIFGEGAAIRLTDATGVADGPVPNYNMSQEDKISCLVDLTQKVFLTVERELQLTGFWESIPARNKLKAELQRILLAPEFLALPGLVKNRAHIISRIMGDIREEQ